MHRKFKKRQTDGGGQEWFKVDTSVAIEFGKIVASEYQEPKVVASLVAQGEYGQWITYEYDPDLPKAAELIESLADKPVSPWVFDVKDLPKDEGMVSKQVARKVWTACCLSFAALTGCFMIWLLMASKGAL